MRYTVKSMIFMTTFVAAGVIIIVESNHGMTPAWIAASGLYWGLTI
jgi:hypothetical protein